MSWSQKNITLPPKRRGAHLITDFVEQAMPEISEYRIGIAHIFIQHTSASLTINENADPTVRADMEAHLNVMVPENAAHYQHTLEGPDDMPAHIKSSLLGNSLSIPIGDGRLMLGAWQGIYLFEHRNASSSRRLVVTLNGERF